MTTGTAALAALVLGLACLAAIALIGHHQTQQQPEGELMAQTDYRKLVDELRTESGETFALALEVVASSAASHDGPAIRVEALTAYGRGFEPVRLTEHDAGAIYDALGGALRAIATPADAYPPVTSWGHDTARALVKQIAAAQLSDDITALGTAETEVRTNLNGLARSEALELAAALAHYAGVVVADFATVLADHGAAVDLEQASA